MSPLSHRKVMPPLSVALFFANRMPCGLASHYPVLISSRQSKWLVACYCICPLSFLGFMIILSQFFLFLWLLREIKFSKFSALVSYFTDYHNKNNRDVLVVFRSRKIWGFLLFSFSNFIRWSYRPGTFTG
ncbi:hypothetical protein OIU78_002416 [Salix suchowensis]|nr:hypothetical protein OIU78_002416 [Salix suchowensis]